MRRKWRWRVKILILDGRKEIVKEKGKLRVKVVILLRDRTWWVRGYDGEVGKSRLVWKKLSFDFSVDIIWEELGVDLEIRLI